MTVTDERPAGTSAPLLLPPDPPRLGPISRRLHGRLAGGLFVVQVLGALLVFVADSDVAHAAGASLVFPGTGFVYVAWPMLFLLTAAMLVVALVLWWGASAHLAIPVVWLVSVGGAAALADGPRLFVDRGTTWGWAIPLAYALAVSFVGVAVYRFERSFRAKRAKISELNTYLATDPAPPRQTVGRDLGAMDVELLRWCYSMADQPNDDLIGLDWGEQFHSGTQLRYQLNALCWALSLYAANYLPNAQHQVEAALSRMILKHTDLRVWRYWRALNLLGNLDPSPDPIRRDNIMFSAFFGDVLNIYEAATGSTRFDEPGSLTFVWKDGRTFEYDHHTIIDAVEENYRRSRLGFFSCEPGWSFTVCNVMGAQSLFGHDTLHGTDAWKRVSPRWVETLEHEYSTPDGSYAHIKSNLVGLAWDTGEVPGGHYLAAGSNRFADILPAHARRATALELHRSGAKLRSLGAMVDDGHLELELPLTLERCRTRKSALGAWNGVIGGARMVGEHELVDAALDASARQCGTGLRWPDRPLDSGMQAFGAHMIVRWSAPLSTADLNVRGYEPPAGPILDDAPWGDVLVTEARSHDGASLSLRLEPFDATAVEAATLRFRQLHPGSGYRLHGTGTDVTLNADDDGRADATVVVSSPARLVLEPENGPS